MSGAPHTVVVGAGVGGLTAAALLVRAGHRVTVLEGHVYPGGSAGTFYHQKYRFDAGASLAGGFAPGGPHARVAEALGLEWPITPVDPAWIVHLPDGRMVTQWADRGAWRAERRRAFPTAEPFWRVQERLADLSWDISSRPFPWPPRSAADLTTLAAALRPRTLRALPYLGRTVGDLAADDDPLFRLFLDGQLLISAQTTADRAGALYGSAALDLPRRGVNHVRGGIGSLARTLADWIAANGGEVRYRQRVERIEVGRDGRAAVVHTVKGLSLSADYVLANVTPWGLRDLLGANAPPGLRRDVQRLEPTWGAFTLYLGLDANCIPAGSPDHHQIIADGTRPLGEGNSVFLSLAPAGDPGRAPPGMRAATLSTHTDIAPWWRLRDGPDEAAYQERREVYAERLITAAERAIPGLRRAIRLCLPGTPVTFQYYTGRPGGMVGGFAQGSLFAARGPQTGIPNLWLVGDSIFPGQSTAGVTLGAMRVAAEAVRHRDRRRGR
ncbi:phytoene desaturase family protein [Promineifilum sp.]|uniref:phytoene desaturase family protein n=1 Tax=Promineifilum sp. TaxID=2664178 RepID=UPI0035B0B23F